MADAAQYEELMRQLSAIGSVRRELGRNLPDGCSNVTATVLALLGRDGDMRIGRLAELLAVDMSVTSRHVAHVAARGWIDRSPDPADRRSRILRLTPAGRAVLARLSEHTARTLARRLSGWSDEEIRRLTCLMARLRASFEDPWTDEEPWAERHPGTEQDPGTGPPRDERSPRTSQDDRSPHAPEDDRSPRTPAVTT
ncbi:MULTISPECIES: MarR family winged helix-turn-helix transcriptional regulator [Streptomyces]|uniref:MarR family transcriptional regulator n=1 Tax=Streptomyces canarius TaxID=285453 RepID=A0ABQ3D6T6_9ACTN|nr:MarR family winged helix-turn-helix transcriptional regulator [Streptomyces canarius]GHA61685.1 MarR family transcriptional regulator [Streptomyces canarius]